MTALNGRLGENRQSAGLAAKKVIKQEARIYLVATIKLLERSKALVELFANALLLPSCKHVNSYSIKNKFNTRLQLTKIIIMTRSNTLKLPAIAFAIWFLVSTEYTMAQNLGDDASSQQADNLILENTNLLRGIVELIPNESRMDQAQPFPLELQEQVNSAIDGFLSHSDRLLLLSEQQFSAQGAANCRNMLDNFGYPTLARMQADYNETRDVAAPSSDQNMQLANLFGYSILAASSLSKVHSIHQTLTACNGANQF